jgi:hypothetical protein
MKCEHEDFMVDAVVNRLMDGKDAAGAPQVGFVLDLKVNCSECGEKFVFVGLPNKVGLSPLEPRTDFNGTELRAPIRPKSEAAGLFPGFTITQEHP